MGSLTGLKVIEMAGLGPAPFAGMLLADMGADVLVVDRPENTKKFRVKDGTHRGKRFIHLDLKKENDLNILLKLIEKADVLFEGYRPGVMEKLGLSPTLCFETNPQLIYGRMTGWGQEGPLAKTAGHDLNYISLTGVLNAIGRTGQKPSIPLNLIGDYGGGSLFLVVGILAALYEVKTSGKGQVIDAAITDGSALLMSIFHTLTASGLWTTTRGENWLDSGSHFYEIYETKDEKYISIAAIEPQFYNLLIEKLNLDKAIFSSQNDPTQWTSLKIKFQHLFKTKTQTEWCNLLEGTDVCFAPVLNYLEATQHSHNKTRQTYIEIDGLIQPAPAPRFSRTPSIVKTNNDISPISPNDILKEWS